MKRFLVLSTALLLAGALPSRATLLVRELWDNVTNAPQVAASTYSLQGSTNGSTTVGLQGIWNVNPNDLIATNALQINSSLDINPYYLNIYTDLPFEWSMPGSLYLPASNTNGWDSGTWATRIMTSGSFIHLNSASTNYIAIRWVKRSFFYTVSGTNGYGEDDAGLGIGLANGNGAGSTFIGIGITRSVARNTYDGTGYPNLAGTVDIGDTPYITSGTLGQAGYPGHPGDSGGPYYVRAYAGDGSGSGVTNQCEGYTGGYPTSSSANQYMWGGILVGRIVTTVGGNTEIDVKNYSGWDTLANVVDQSPTPVTGWDAVYNFSSTATLNSLLIWMYGNNRANPCQIDGIRMATTWGEILGEEVETPTISPSNPTNTYFQGTPLTINGVGSVDSGSGWYEWLYNSNAPALSYSGTESNSFPLPSPVIANSGYYTLAFSNGWESGSTLIVTSPPIHLNIVTPSAPIFTSEPQPGGRYSAPGTAPFTFTTSILGTPPYTYRWFQIVGGVTNLLSTVANTNAASSTFTLTAPIPPSAIGSYFVNASNFLGGTNSPPVSFSVFTVSPGTYAAQVISNAPWAYWRLDENYGITNLHDYFGGNDGSILDPTNAVLIGTNLTVGGVFQDQPAAPYAGFPANHVGLYIPVNPFGALTRVNMPTVGNYVPNMTWMAWVYAPAPNENIWGEDPFMWNRDQNNAGGFGNAFGLTFIQATNSSGAVTRNAELAYRWGGGADSADPMAGYLGHYFPSGLFAPTNSWFFVAVSWVAPGNATLYLGNSTGPLSSSTATIPSFDSTYPGDTYTNGYPVLLGRGGYPWAEGGQGNAFNGANVYMSDVAIFTNVLSAATINQIYFAAMGEAVTASNSTGGLVLSWPQGTLISTTNLLGTWSVVPGASSPFTVHPVPSGGPQQFYRVQR